MGPYRALFGQNIPIDYVHADDVGESGISGYKLLYVPYPIMMGERTAQAVARFVEQGGYVVAEARAGWNDARGYATPTIPGFGLDQVFGARETVVTPVQRTALVVKSKNAAIPLLDEGARLPGMIYQEAVEPLGGGQVIASFLDGSPAMVVSSHGKGKTLYVGSYLSLAYERTKDSQSQGFFQGLLDWAGVERPVSASPGIEVRSLEGSNYKLEFVLNGAEKEVPAGCGCGRRSRRRPSAISSPVKPCLTAGMAAVSCSRNRCRRKAPGSWRSGKGVGNDIPSVLAAPRGARGRPILHSDFPRRRSGKYRLDPGHGFRSVRGRG